MRFVQYRQGEESHPGILHQGNVIDLADLLTVDGGSDRGILSLQDFIAAGPKTWGVVERSLASEKILSHLDRIALGEGPGDNLLDAPLRSPAKLVLVAGNYRKHIREVGYQVPETGEVVTPQFFLKPATTVIGPGESICLPHQAVWVDWEVELAIVIGIGGRHISEAQARDHIFGYTILNDISERAFNSNVPGRKVREKDPYMDWLHGKWFDTFAPMGPVVVTQDEIPDPHSLQISLARNGTLEQAANTAEMIHTVDHLIARLSEIMTLEPGDVISTGTPSGVGFGKGKRLEDGDVLECRIERIGMLTNPVRKRGYSVAKAPGSIHSGSDEKVTGQ